MLRGFNWDRVAIVQTDTVFSSGLSTSFQQLWTGKHNDASGAWEGDIAYTHSIVINPDESVNDESVRQALDRVPTDDPINNSRVILLIAHNQHAFSILKTAAKMKFQPDTIWIGVDAWSNRYPTDMDGFMSAFPEDDHPGYVSTSTTFILIVYYCIQANRVVSIAFILHILIARDHSIHESRL